MDKEKSLYTLIYGVILTRIMTGYYMPGDQILIKPMCELIDISNITVRNALRRLEKEGYVSLSKNQRATVIWEPSGQEPPPSDQFYVDRNSMLDLYKSYSFFLPAFVCEGLRLCSGAELEALKKIPNGLHRAADKPIVHQVKQIIRKLGNPLILNLHRDILLFGYPTYRMYLQKGLWKESGFLSRVKQLYGQAIGLCEKGEYGRMRGPVRELYGAFGELPVYTSEELFHVPARPYRMGKIQVGFSISISLILRISSGIYPIDSFLPSAEALAKQFSVSKMTIRRTVWMLNSLGITETINGVGTRVILSEKGAANIHWDNPEIQKRMLFFLYSMQILLMTCRGVTKAVFPLIPAAEKQRMADEMEADSAVGMFDGVYSAWLTRIIRYGNYAAVGEIYTHLKNLLSWGLPLRFSKYNTKYPKEAGRVIAGFRHDDIEEAVEALERYLYRSFTECRQHMIVLGIASAETVAVPVMNP